MTQPTRASDASATGDPRGDAPRLVRHAAGDERVVEIDGGGRVVLATAGDALDLWMRARGDGATWLALRADELAPAFFELRSGLAGDVLQKLVTYRARLAIVGDVAAPTARSEALAALVRESNRGRDVWFVATIDELLARLRG